MARTFLDKNGLDALWTLIKSAVNTLVEMVNGKADKSHTHTVSQITDLKVGGRNLAQGTSSALRQVGPYNATVWGWKIKESNTYINLGLWVILQAEKWVLVR